MRSAIGGEWQAGSGAADGSLADRWQHAGRICRSVGRSKSMARFDARGAAFPAWRDTPAPVRGELVRRIGNAFREHQADLADAGHAGKSAKIPAEARGEVQEVIDICDFAVGLSRQLYGKTIASERPAHRLTEYWHPLGPVGVISAFNFPVAVWAWNAMIGLVCGDPIVWKPSEKTPLCAIACQALVQRVIARRRPARRPAFPTW